MFGTARVEEDVGIQERSGPHRRQPGDLFGNVRGPVHGRLAQPGPESVVARPVDLLAPCVRRDDEGAAEPGRVRETVQRAQPVHGHAQSGPERGGRHQPDAQPGVRSRPDTDDDARDGVQFQPGFGEYMVDGGQQQLPMTAGIGPTGLGDHGCSVVEGSSDGGRGGINSEQEHTNSLRLPQRGHGAPSRQPAAATVTGNS